MGLRRAVHLLLCINVTSIGRALLSQAGLALPELEIEKLMVTALAR